MISLLHLEQIPRQLVRTQVQPVTSPRHWVQALKRLQLLKVHLQEAKMPALRESIRLPSVVTVMGMTSVPRRLAKARLPLGRMHWRMVPPLRRLVTVHRPRQSALRPLVITPWQRRRIQLHWARIQPRQRNAQLRSVFLQTQRVRPVLPVVMMHRLPESVQ